MEIDTTNMCSHLKRKLFEEDGAYYKIWLALQADNELSAIVRSRQLHIYRNGKKILILAGKGFHFKAEFQDWLHNNAAKTYKEAVAAYHS